MICTKISFRLFNKKGQNKRNLGLDNDASPKDALDKLCGTIAKELKEAFGDSTIKRENVSTEIKEWIDNAQGVDYLKILNELFNITKNKDDGSDLINTLSNYVFNTLSPNEQSAGESVVQEKSTIGNNTEEENKGNDDSEPNYEISLEYETDLNECFGGHNSLLINHVKNRFKKDIVRRMLFKVVGNNNEYANGTVLDFNISIASYKISLYKQLQEFVISKNPNFERKDVFSKDGEVDKSYILKLFSEFKAILKLDSNRKNTLLLDWSSLFGRKRSTDEEDAVEESITKTEESSTDTVQNKTLSKKNEEVTLLDAVDAYLFLAHFDELISTIFPEISIDSNYAGQEIRLYEFGGEATHTPILKYTIKKNNSNAVKNWNIGEFRDALKESSELTKKVCLLIPSLNEKGRKMSDNSLISQFALAWNNLYVSIINKSNPQGWEKILQDTILLFENAPNETVHKVLKILFPTINSKNCDLFITDNGLTEYQANLLRGVYYVVYKMTPNSGNEELEKSNIGNSIAYSEANKKNIILSNFFLQDIVTMIFRGIKPVRYLGTTEEFDEVYTLYKRMNSLIEKDVFDYLSGLNSRYSRMGDKELENLLFLDEDLTDPLVSIKLNDVIYKDSMIINLGGQKYIVRSYDHNLNNSPFIGEKSFLSIRIFRYLDEIEKDSIVSQIFPTDSPQAQQLRQLLLNYTSEVKNEKTGLSNTEMIERIIDNNVTDKKLKSELKRKLCNIDFSQWEYGSDFRNALTNQEDIDPDSTEGLKIEMVKFIDKFLLLGLTTPEGAAALEIAILNLNFSITAFVKAAVKAAYVAAWNYELHQQSDMSFLEFATKNIDGYADLKNNHSVFLNEYGVPFIKVCNNSEDWPAYYISAKATLMGDDVKSTSNDINNNKRANYRNSSLATEWPHYINEQRNDLNSAMHYGLFQQNPRLIVDVAYDSEMLTLSGDKILTKDATLSELIYNGIVNNFWNSFAISGEYHVLPTVYSDKTSIATFKIDGKGTIDLQYEEGKRITKKLIELTPEESEIVYLTTIGTYHTRLLNAIVSEFKKLFSSIEILNSVLNTKGLTQVDIDTINAIFNTLNNNGSNIDDHLIQRLLGYITESKLQDLISIYNTANFNNLVTIAREVHYRINPNKTLSLNEESLYYAKYLKRKGALGARFYKEKRNFLSLLLSNRISFKYNSRTKESPILKAVKQLSDNYSKNDTANAFGDNQIRRMILEDTNISKEAKERINYIFNLNPIGKTMSQTDLDKIKVELGESKYTDYVSIYNGKSSFLTKTYELNWVKNGRLILAKDKNGNEIRYIRQLENLDGEFILNPLLDKYFYVDNIVSANLKYSLLGNEIADPLKFELTSVDEDKKTHSKIIDTVNNILKKYGKYFTEQELEKYKSYTLSDLYYELEQAEQSQNFGLTDLSKEEQDRIVTRLRVLSEAYETITEQAIAISEGAQYKRNVIMSATRTPLITDSLTGVGLTTKVAMIDDTKAEIFNYLGDRAKEDANDGSGFINGVLSILENRSLPANAVGYEVKKPIWYHYDPKTGTSVLLKFAVYATTNAEMRMSTRSAMATRMIFKKMNNIRWSRHGFTGDISNSVYYRPGTKNGDTVNHRLTLADITSALDSGNRLFYKSEGRVYEILGLRKEGDVYYTKEREFGTEKITEVANIYKNSDSEIIKIRKPEQLHFSAFYDYIQKTYIDSGEYHSIDSLYELWGAFGGENSVLQKGEEWEGSENSTYAIVNVMNNVFEPTSYLDENGNRKLANQQNFKQPLKNMFIGYAVNTSAAKRGQFNVNPAESWKDPDYEWSYMELNNKGLGPQQDPDHEADEAEVAEMTQVMISLDVGGELHYLAKDAFLYLGLLISHGMENEQNILDKLTKIILNKTGEKDELVIRSQFYDLLAREFLHTFKTTNQFDLSDNIIARVKKCFELSSEDMHVFDEVKLPASDPNVFQALVSLFVSHINKTAMKRRYSGEAAVMVPSYEKALIFHFNEDGLEVTLTSLDIKNKAFKYKGRDIYDKRTVKYDSTTDSYMYTMVNGGIDAVLHKNENGETLLSFNLLSKELTTLGKLQLLTKIKRDIMSNDIIKFESAEIDNNTESYKEVFLNLLPDIKLLEKLGFVLDESKTDGLYFQKQEVTDTLVEELLMDEFLKEEQNKKDDSGAYIYDIDPTKVLPTDKINIISNGNVVASLDLSNIDDYYNFKEYFCSDRIKNAFKNFVLQYKTNNGIAPEQVLGGDTMSLLFELFWEENFYSDSKQGKKWKPLILWSLKEGLRFQQNIISPSLLRPQRVSFQSRDGKYYNLYDLDPIKEAHYAERTDHFDKHLKKGVSFWKELLFKEWSTPEHQLANPNQEFADYKKLRLQELNQNNDIISRDLRKIQNSIRTLMNEHKAIINGETLNIRPDSFVNEAAEMLMSNVYATKFNLTTQTMYDMTKELPIIETRIFDYPCELTMVGNRKSIGLTFIQPESSKKQTVRTERFREIVSPEEETVVDENGNSVVKTEYKIYAESKKTRGKNYQIGTSIDVSDKYEYDEKTGIFRNKTTKASANNENLIIRGTKVYLNIYFVLKFQIVKENKTYNILYINQNECKKRNVDIGLLTKQICDCDKFTYLQLNEKLGQRPKNSVLNDLKNLQIKNDNSFYSKFLKVNIDFLEETDGEILLKPGKRASKNKEGRDYATALNVQKIEYNKSLKYHYEISKLVMSARIPAQTLQSYMQMKCVGYIPTTSNQCMVSHWQTWLLGSKINNN